MASTKKTNILSFTGRNVPLNEIAKATGKSVQYLARGLREEKFDFGVAMKSENGEKYSYFCPDKLVWEKLGYFNPDAKPVNVE